MKLFGRVALAVTLACAGPAAYAFDVLPTITVIELPKDAKGATVVISNPRAVALPISIEMVERTINEDGSESQVQADHLFRVFPEQAVLQPGKRQTIRVIWMGTAKDRSRSFTMYASEVPVDLENSTTSGVQRILRIGASIHIVPPGTRAVPKLVRAVPEGSGVRVTLANEGTRFVYLNDLTISFGAKTLNGEQIAAAAERTLLPPGGRRTFVIPGVTGTPEVKLAS